MAKFILDGALTTRGEIVSSYAKGDELQVLKEEGNLVQVLITTGESKGSVAFIDPNLIEN